MKGLGASCLHKWRRRTRSEVAVTKPCSQWQPALIYVRSNHQRSYLYCSRPVVVWFWSSFLTPISNKKKLKFVSLSRNLFTYLQPLGNKIIVQTLEKLIANDNAQRCIEHNRNEIPDSKGREQVVSHLNEGSRRITMHKHQNRGCEDQLTLMLGQHYTHEPWMPTPIVWSCPAERFQCHYQVLRMKKGYQNPDFPMSSRFFTKSFV